MSEQINPGDESSGARPLEYRSAHRSVGRSILRVIGILFLILLGVVLLLLGICAVLMMHR